MRPARALSPWRKTLRTEAKGQPAGRRSTHRRMTSLLTSPQQGPDAAGMVKTPLTGRPPKPAIPACSAPGTDAVSGVGPGGAGGACGRDAQASPAVPCLVCGGAAEPGDDLCRSHGGMADGIERHAAMRAVA